MHKIYDYKVVGEAWDHEDVRDMFPSLLHPAEVLAVAEQ